MTNNNNPETARMRKNTPAWGPSLIPRPCPRDRKKPRRRSITSRRRSSSRRVGSAAPAPTAARELHPIRKKRSHSSRHCAATARGC